jgi:hypothetical protein
MYEIYSGELLMTEEQYRELDFCICRYNSYFPYRSHVDRGLVLERLLRSLRGNDGKILMNKFIDLMQSK